MSLILESTESTIPQRMVEYAMAHNAEGKTILVYRRCFPCTSYESYDFIATGEDSDKDVLEAKGYTCIHMYTPDVSPVHDRTFEPPYNAQCC
jgi:hypothetical protein